MKEIKRQQLLAAMAMMQEQMEIWFNKLFTIFVESEGDTDDEDAEPKGAKSGKRKSRSEK